MYDMLYACACYHIASQSINNVGPDVLDFPNFYNTCKLNWASSIIAQVIHLVTSGPVRSFFNLLGPKLLLGLYCNYLQFLPFWPSPNPIKKHFSGPNFNFWFLKVQNNFGPVLDFGLNHIEAQQPVEKP